MLHLSTAESERLIQIRDTLSRSNYSIYLDLERLLREASELPLRERVNNESVPLEELRLEVETGIASLQSELQSYQQEA